MARRALMFVLLILSLQSCGTDPRTAPESLVATFTTSLGVIEMELYPHVAPLAVANFRGLVDRGYYDGTIFHRVIADFMIQGGDPESTGGGGESIWGHDFEDELNDSVLFDRVGRFAMANHGPNTNGSQFFVTVKATPWLNNKHTIFGQVIKGMNVVNDISMVPRRAGDRPTTDITIRTITIVTRNSPSTEVGEGRKPFVTSPAS